MTTPDDTEEKFVVSLQRSLEILRCFRHGTGPFSMPEIAVRTGLPKPTANRLLHTLLHLGCVERLSNGRYRPGPRTVALGRSLLGALPIRNAARPFMQALAERHDVSVALGAAHGTEMICLEYCVGTHTMSGRLQVGSILPMARTVMGRAYVWALVASDREAELAGLILQTGDDALPLEQAIRLAFAELDRQGFCTSRDPWRPEAFALGAPLILDHGGTVLALTCAAPSLGLDEQAMSIRCGPDLVRTVEAIRSAVDPMDAEWLGLTAASGLP